MRTLLAFLLSWAAALAQTGELDDPIFVSGMGSIVWEAPPISITYDNSTTSTSVDPSISHSQGALSGNGFALVLSGWTFSGSTAGATATYAGDSMTQIEIVSQASFYHLAAFTIDIATEDLGAGSKTVAIAHADAATSAFTIVISYDGVEQGATFTDNSVADYAQNPSVSVTTTATDELVVAGMSSAWTDKSTVTEGHTLYAEDDTASVTYSFQHADGTGGAVSMNWTTPDSGHSAKIAVVLTPAT